MADKGPSSLTAATLPLGGTEVVHTIQSSNSRKTTVQDIANIGSPIETETGTTYSTAAADRGKWKRMNNAAAIAVTVSDVTHTAGDEIHFEQTGAGVVTFSAGGSLTLNSRGSLVSTNGQSAVAGIKFITASLAVLFGDLV